MAIVRDTTTRERSTPRIESRVVRLENIVETIAEQLEGLSTAVRDQSRQLSTEIDTMTKDLRGEVRELSAARLPNWQLIVSAVGLCVLLISTIGGMAVVPLYLSASYSRADSQRALEWQDDYMRGKIPASGPMSAGAAAAMAAQDQKFVEVETQFRGFRERMLENEELAKGRAEANARRIDENRLRLEKLMVDQAHLDERTRAGGKP